MHWIIIVFVLIIIDQLTKWAASLLNWSIFLNNDFAFSLPVPIVLMYAIYVSVLTGIGVYLFKSWHRFDHKQKLAWSFVLAGGLSNIGERIMLGAVRDFIPIANGMLNVADFFILGGLILLLVSQRFADSKATEKF